ncbi:MAG: hypothetical protein HY874_09705 [Chloroflexi bacterium]|nr:hypothetical protein [Chloroflexota bacterium]
MTAGVDDSVLDLAITPLGLAGVSVGENLDAVVARLGPPMIRRPDSDSPDENVEILEYGGFVVIAVEGIVDGVMAIEGYRGETLGGVYVGMPWTDLLARYPGLYFDEPRFAWRLPGWPHLDLEIRRPSSDDEFEDEGPWAEEWYEITDPEEAFVSLIVVTLDA